MTRAFLIAATLGLGSMLVFALAVLAASLAPNGPLVAPNPFQRDAMLKGGPAVAVPAFAAPGHDTTADDAGVSVNNAIDDGSSVIVDWQTPSP